LRQKRAAALLVVKFLLQLPLCVFGFTGCVRSGISSNSCSGGLEFIRLTGFLRVVAPLRLQDSECSHACCSRQSDTCCSRGSVCANHLRSGVCQVSFGLCKLVLQPRDLCARCTRFVSSRLRLLNRSVYTGLRRVSRAARGGKRVRVGLYCLVLRPCALVIRVGSFEG
jgi:hypothetical protein